MFQKGLSFAAFLCVVFISTVWNATAQSPKNSMPAACKQHVKIATGKLIQTREVRSGDGCLSQRDLTLHFGIADYEQIDSIEVQWQSGIKQLIKSVPANQVLFLEEIRDE